MSAVIFLDIDGVMNAGHLSYKRGCFLLRPPDWTPGLTPEGKRQVGMDPWNVAHMNTLVAMTGARVVLSSDWRLEARGTEGVRCECVFTQENLNRAGATFQLHDATPWIPGEDRGLEIAAWLAHNPDVDRCTILDDRDDMRPVAFHLVQTNPRMGMEAKHVEAALHRLERPLNIKREAILHETYGVVCGWTPKGIR